MTQSSLGRWSQNAATKLHVKSALNPMLWLCAITIPLFLGTAYIFKDNQAVVFLLILAAIFPLILTGVGFMYFAINKPEKLQSEDYQLRHESLQIIQKKGSSKTIPLNTIEAIANPANTQKRIEGGQSNA
ncbi:TPA: hypothetical protein ACX6SR_001916 [Photobacterium damselae]|uniref:Uncharacterized protein n=1 Tax=Photobacterium damselae subsp. damselae TaxID=85581 RepID=A0A850QTL0_PHODD|nr:hypothetical protein [Photobacterium damselae subsp. damselae]